MICLLLAAVFVLFSICACSVEDDDEQTDVPTGNAETSATPESTAVEARANRKAFRELKIKIKEVRLAKGGNMTIWYDSNHYFGEFTEVTRLIYKKNDYVQFLELKTPTAWDGTGIPTESGYKVEVLIVVFKKGHRLSDNELDFLSDAGINYMYEEN